MLKVSGLRHRYGDLVALSDVSFEVDMGQIVGLVGRNGAGKTTTMRSVMSLIRPEAGKITWDDVPVGSVVRAQFGYMPEERGLYPQMTVANQLRYFARLHGCDKAMAANESQRWIDRLGLTGREGDRLVALSHGNQQRVQLAVALVHEPRLLVLDEPFAGLDPSAVDSLSEILRALVEDGIAVLFSSHQLDLVERLCDRVVILERGRVVAAGNLDELRQRLPERLRVKIAGSSSWAAQMTGVEIVDDGPDGVLLVLDPSVDPQTVLRRAMASGAVEHFGYEQAGLVDLYRELVAS